MVPESCGDQYWPPRDIAPETFPLPSGCSLSLLILVEPTGRGERVGTNTRRHFEPRLRSAFIVTDAYEIGLTMASIRRCELLPLP
jgi:hypothetical protein